MRGVLIVALVAAAFCCFAMIADVEAAPCPGGKCPVPATVLHVPVTAEVAHVPLRPVRKAARAVAAKRPVRSLAKVITARKPGRRMVAAIVERRPVRRLAGGILKLPRVALCRR